jgi:hypothetical protein
VAEGSVVVFSMPMTTPATRRAPVVPLLALGATLARRGVLATISIVVGIFTVLIACVIGLALARRGGDAPVHAVPLVASSALAWGAGFLLAFGSAAHALRKDREGGIQHLLVARTTSLRAYVAARVGGLAAVLAAVVAGGTLVVGLVAAAASPQLGDVPRTLHATLAAVVFALAFSAVLAPIAFAALGARSRVGGYFFMLFVVVLPEAIAGILSSALPESITEVLAIPSALGALRSALSPGTTDVLRAIRAVVALGLWSLFASALVRRTAQALGRGEDGA